MAFVEFTTETVPVFEFATYKVLFAGSYAIPSGPLNPSREGTEAGVGDATVVLDESNEDDEEVV